MDHEKLRAMVNRDLKRPALVGLTPERGKKITNGLSSGSLMLNMALSGSPFIGYVWGRIIEIYGPEASGKTTLALHAIREAQRLEGSSGKPVPCLFIDVEHALDAYYAECLGIDLENMTISQPGCAEDALNEAEAAIEAGFKVIVIDSVSALVPRAEVEGEMGEAHVGLQARIMSQAMRKLTGIMSKAEIVLIFVNQFRIKVGVTWGNPETTSGGNALKYYAAYRLEIRSPRTGKKTGKSLMGYGVEQNVELGIDANVKVTKNKVFPPHRRASFTIVYGQGIDKVHDTIAFLEFVGAFKKPPKTSKIKSDVLRIESKKKLYTAAGLAKILHETEVQKEVLDKIKKLEVAE